MSRRERRRSGRQSRVLTRWDVNLLREVLNDWRENIKSRVTVKSGKVGLKVILSGLGKS